MSEPLLVQLNGQYRWSLRDMQGRQWVFSSDMTYSFLACFALAWQAYGKTLVSK